MLEAGKAPIEKLREAAATELYAIIELVRRALAIAMYPLRPRRYVELYAIYPDRAIVRDGGRLYAFPYTIDASEQRDARREDRGGRELHAGRAAEAAATASSSRR
jgi:hypothetical protein